MPVLCFKRDAKKVSKLQERITLLERQLIDKENQISQWKSQLEREAVRNGMDVITDDDSDVENSDDGY